MACEHLNFDGSIGVHRLSTVVDGPIDAYCAEVRIKCSDCGLPFEFIGVPQGLSGKQPMASIDFQELNCPIAPQGEKVRDFGGFTVSNKPIRTPSGLSQ